MRRRLEAGRCSGLLDVDVVQLKTRGQLALGGSVGRYHPISSAQCARGLKVTQEQ